MKLKNFLVVFFLAIVGFLAYNIYIKATHIKTAKAAVNSLPDFEFISLDGKAVTRAQAVNKPVWIVFFLTDCEYCLMEVDNILASKGINKANIWLVSPEPEAVLQVFLNKNKLVRFPNIKILRDWKNQGSTVFAVASTPTSFLYAKSGSLIKKYNGAVKPEVVVLDLAKTTK